MLRRIVATMVVLAVGGFGIGWWFSPAPAPPPIAVPQPIVSVRHAFPLLPADRHADKEIPALVVRGSDVLLAWASATGDGEFTIFLASSRDGGDTFDVPRPFRKVRIHRFTASGRNRAMTFSTAVQPRLALADDTIVLGWTESEGGGPRVSFHVARSTDGGRTFSEPTVVHGPAAQRPGFTAMDAGPDGVVACTWLDGRNRAQQPFVSIASPSFAPEQLVYDGPDGKGICPCCDLGVHRIDGVTYVAFRNAELGRRDIVVCRSDVHGFSVPTPVSADEWELQGCPHDGPGLASGNDRLYVMWMSGHTGQRRVYLAASPRNRKRLEFSRLPFNPPGNAEQGHPRLAVSQNYELTAVWDQSLSDEPPAESAHGHHHGIALTGAGRAIMFSNSDDGGLSFAAPRAIAPKAGVFQVQPAVAVANGDTFFAWNEIDAKGKYVVIACLPGPRYLQTPPVYPPLRRPWWRFW